FSRRLRRRSPSTLFPYTTLFRSSPEIFRPAHRISEATQEAGCGAAAGVRPSVELFVVERIEEILVLLGGELPLDLQGGREVAGLDRKSTRLNSSHVKISYAVFCL